jgi:hypothetical protein
MMKLADRTSRIAGSATIARLRRSGVEVIDFGAGEPDFSTPEPIKLAGHQALDANFTRYTPVGGIADLKKAICDRYQADYGVDYKENQVITTAGGKQALYNTALSLFGPGDEVITHRAGRRFRSRSSWPTPRRCSRARMSRTGFRCTRRQSSTPSRRAPAASSSTRRAIRPER